MTRTYCPDGIRRRSDRRRQSGLEPGIARATGLGGVADAIMKPVGTVLPELERWGLTRIPPHHGGRGTGPPANSASTSSTRASRRTAVGDGPALVGGVGASSPGGPVAK